VVYFVKLLATPGVVGGPAGPPGTVAHECLTRLGTRAERIYRD
jgi:hypothetical protein